jgi:O-antigen/teichoic acid export membrane protein
MVARLLGPELYGQYTLALVAPSLLFLFTDLGISQGIIKFTASLRAKGETNRIAKIVKYALLLKASVGIAIFIINYTLAGWFATVLLQRPDLAFYIQIASISVVFQVIFSTVTSAFVGYDKAEYHAITSNIQAIAKTIVSIALVIAGFSVAGALLGYVAGYMIAAVAGGIMLFSMMRNKPNTEKDAYLAGDLKNLMLYGAPLFLSFVLTGFIPLYQNVVLAMFTTDSDVGNYKAAANFATLITVLAIPISTALLPAFSKIDLSTRNTVKKFFRLANKYTTMVILPVTTFIIVFSNEIVQVIYGSTYQTAPLFLAVHSILYFLVGLGYLTLASFYNGLGETKTTLKMSLIVVLLIVILSPLLVMNWGVLGLIIAFLIANGAGNAYGSYAARVNHEIEFDNRSILKIYIVSLLSGVLPLSLLHFSSLPMLLNVLVGALLCFFVFATLTPLAGIINHSELEIAIRVIQRIKPLALITNPLLKYERRILNLHKYNQKPTP